MSEKQKIDAKKVEEPKAVETKEDEKATPTAESLYEAIFTKQPVMKYTDDAGVEHMCAILNNAVFNITVHNKETNQDALIEQVVYRFLLDHQTKIIRIGLFWTDPFGQTQYSIFDRQAIYSQTGFDAIMGPILNKGCFMPFESYNQFRVMLCNQAPLGVRPRLITPTDAAKEPTDAPKEETKEETK